MPVYDSINHYEIGNVKGEVASDSHMILVNSGKKIQNGGNEYSGEYVPHPELKNIVVTVEGQGIYSGENESFMINGQRIAVGKEFYVRLGGFTGIGYCISMDFKLANGQ